MLKILVNPTILVNIQKNVSSACFFFEKVYAVNTLHVYDNIIIREGQERARLFLSLLIAI